MKPSSKAILHYAHWPECNNLEGIHDSLFSDAPAPACKIIKNRLKKPLQEKGTLSYLTQTETTQPEVLT